MSTELLQLAQASFTGEQMGLVVGAIIAALGGGSFLGKKISDSRRVSIEGQPLEVRLKEEFVSRKEFRDLRTEMRLDFQKLEGLLERAGERVENKHLELLATIERAAKVGVDGRVALWNEVTAQGKALVKVQTEVGVAERLERIASEISKHQKDGK